MTQTEWTREQLPRLERAADVPDVLAYGMQQVAVPGGLWLEFGVAGAVSLTRIAQHARALSPMPYVAGFDWFKGLPEDWTWNHSQKVPKGTFAQDIVPVIPGAEIVVGLFQDTVKKWLAKREGDNRVTFVHVDCDLYSASRCVLKEIAPYLAEGAIIVFDELVGYHGFDQHEWRALWETAGEDRAFGFEWLARKASGQQAAIRIRADEVMTTPATPHAKASAVQAFQEWAAASSAPVEPLIPGVTVGAKTLEALQKEKG